MTILDMLNHLVNGETLPTEIEYNGIVFKKGVTKTIFGNMHTDYMYNNNGLIQDYIGRDIINHLNDELYIKK